MPSKSVRFSRTAPQATNSPNPGDPSAEFWTHRQNRLGFGSEIESVLRLVVVNPVHPIPVVEKHRSPAVPICQKSVKPSVQTCRKRSVLFIEVNQIRGPIPVKFMSLLLQTWAVPGSGNSSPEKTSTTSPRSFRGAFRRRKSPFAQPIRRRFLGTRPSTPLSHKTSRDAEAPTIRRTSASAYSRGRRVMHPTIPGMASVYDLSLGILKTGKSSCIPKATDLAVGRSNRLRNPVCGIVVQAQAEGDSTRNC